MADLASLYWWTGGAWAPFDYEGVTTIPANLNTAIKVTVANYSAYHRSYRLQVITPSGLKELEYGSLPRGQEVAEVQVNFNTGLDMDCEWVIRVTDLDGKYPETSVIAEQHVMVRVGIGGLAPGYCMITGVSSPVSAAPDENFGVVVTGKNLGNQPVYISANLYTNFKWWDPSVDSVLVQPGTEGSIAFVPTMARSHTGMMLLLYSSPDNENWVQTDYKFQLIDLQGASTWIKPVTTRLRGNVQLRNDGAEPQAIAPHLALGNAIQYTNDPYTMAPGEERAWGNYFNSPDIVGKSVIDIHLNDGTKYVARHRAGILELRNYLYTFTVNSAGVKPYPEASPTGCCPYFDITITNPADTRVDKTLDVRLAVNGIETGSNPLVTKQQVVGRTSSANWTHDESVLAFPQVIEFGSQVDMWLEDDDGNIMPIFSGLAE